MKVVAPDDAAYFTITMDDQDVLLYKLEGDKPYVPDNNTGVLEYSLLECSIMKREGIISFFEGDGNIMSVNSVPVWLIYYLTPTLPASSPNQSNDAVLGDVTACQQVTAQ